MKWEVQTMRSRTCYFNTAVFFKNVTRFWPVWVSYMLVCLWNLSIYTWTQINAYTASDFLTEAQRAEGRLTNVIDSLRMAVLPVPVFVFGAISGIAVFSYLYRARSANMSHALPVRREELFLTNYISGLLFLLVPQLLAFLVTVFVWFGNGVNQLEYLLQWLGLSAGEAVLAYSLAVFSAMLTGQMAAALVLTVLAMVIYRKRDIESAEAVISIGWMRPLFRWCGCRNMYLYGLEKPFFGKLQRYVLDGVALLWRGRYRRIFPV